MNKNKSMALLSGFLLLLGACKLFDSGSAKADANSVVRRYNRPATEVLPAITAALTSLDLRIEEDRHDALGGELTAVRATKDPVKVLVKSIDETSSQVTISVGYGDRNLADILHTQVAKNLGTGTAKTSFYGGNRWEQTYDSSLARCIVAAERACEALGFTVTNRDIHESSADLMARRGPSSMILLHFEAVAPQTQTGGTQNPPPAANGGVPSDKRGQVKVSFIVGTMRSDEHEEILQRLKNEFDRLVRQ
jgi:hypothetical protein